MRKRDREKILLSLAYQGKDDKKSQTLQDHAGAREIKIEVDEAWLAWVTVYKQVKGFGKALQSLLSMYSNFVLNFKYHAETGKNAECQGLIFRR
eukprot:14415544-Heterocapsa_arctica.AAC.1